MSALDDIEKSKKLLFHRTESLDSFEFASPWTVSFPTLILAYLHVFSDFMCCHLHVIHLLLRLFLPTALPLFSLYNWDFIDTAVVFSQFKQETLLGEMSVQQFFFSFLNLNFQ